MKSLYNNTTIVDTALSGAQTMIDDTHASMIAEAHALLDGGFDAMTLLVLNGTEVRTLGIGSVMERMLMVSALMHSARRTTSGHNE